MQQPEFDIKTPAWKSLCELTTDLAPKFNSRREAFAAALKARPDLVAAALKPATHRGQPAKPGGGALNRAVEKLADAWRG